MTEPNSPTLDAQLDQYTEETESAIDWSIDVDAQEVVVDYSSRPCKMAIAPIASLDGVLASDGRTYQLAPEETFYRSPARLRTQEANGDRDWFVTVPLAPTR